MASCCETDTAKSYDGPCIPGGNPPVKRRRYCGCDLCKKEGYHGRCCGGEVYVRGSADDAIHLERA